MLKLFKSARRSPVRSALLLTSVLTAGLLTYHFGTASRSPAPLSVEMLTVQRDTIQTTLNESGVVMLRNQQTLTSPAEGAVDRVLVQAGDRVEAGQVLLTLRYPERQTVLTQQQVKIQQQQRQQQHQQQRIQELQVKLNAEVQELRDLSIVAKEGAIARQRLYDQEDQVREGRLALQEAQTQVQVIALELENLQLEQQRIQQELDNTVVTAPMTGLVLGVEVKDGDGVEVRTQLMTIGDPAQVLVRLELPTLTAAQVKVNQRVQVSVIGPNSQIFMGRIQSLSPMATSPSEDTGNRSRNPQQPTVPAIVRLDAPTRTLIPGSRVNVEIILEQRQNVVVLPTEAIQRSAAEPFVWVQDDQGKAQRRSITLGLEGLTQVEVTFGIQPDEQVILQSEGTVLEPGMPIASKDEHPK